MANYRECEHAGIDPKIVERFEKRIEKLLKDMNKYNLHLFCGSAGSIRYDDGLQVKRPLILGDVNGNNHDGGCGAEVEDIDGLLRGE